MRKTILPGAAALCALATTTHAQTVAPAPVEALQVSARNLEDTLPEQLAQTGVKVDVIPGSAIRNGAYPDVATALQQLAPGVFVLPENGPFSTNVDVSVLGSRPQDVLWLVDGVRINNRLFAATHTPLETVPAGIIDHIEVLDGGQSLFYGTQASAGAINIVTKPLSGGLSGAVNLAGDTNTRRHADANLGSGTPLGEFVVYGSADKGDGYKAFRDADYQPSHGDRERMYQMYTEGLKYGVDLTGNLRLQASYQRSDGKLALPFPYRIADDYDERTENLGTVKLDWQATERLGLFVKGYYHDWTSINTIDLANPLLPGATIGYRDHLFQGFKDYGVNALGKFDVARGVQAYFGYDLQKYGGRSDSTLISQTEETVNAGFGQIRLTPDLIPNLNLAAGFRYNSPSKGPSSTIWNVSGRYQLPQGFYAKAEFGTNFNLPTAEQLFVNDRVVAELGNPNLKPEQSMGGEFTLGSRFEVLGHVSHIEATAFGRDITNAIDFTSVVAATRQQVFGNLAGVTTTRGGQVEADVALTPSIKANLAYTYNETRDSTHQQLLNIPLQLMKAGLDWNPANLPYGATATFAYTGQVAAAYNTGRVNYGEYATVDISGRYFFDPARHHMFNLSVQNLFDRQYGVFYRGCQDVLRDFPLGCSKPYPYQSLGLPRTVTASYSYKF